MRLTRIKTKIPNSPYITKKLDSETAQKLLDSSPFVLSGIYEIKNDAKRLHMLYEENEIQGCKLSAYVKVNYGYAGTARAQINNIIPWKELIRKKPSYELRINFYNEEQLIIHSFNCKYTNINALYDDLETQTRILEEVIYSEMKQN